ncbi:hypothetical protein D9619_007814 [Psilocybe cf. subviscida]|uniref:F-box domain-containing protein n=1 Tax=Psilocybe cf. subviscida TaxID=2480587 RepID=A0A8H5ESI8_9AGAR|nr:hypothetical protein D9619_007814 [Psilocybe cf. subviscida]
MGLFSRAQGPLRSLPVEILCHILDRMEMKDLLACSLVAKHFRKVIVESSRLQYIIELARHCAVSLLPSSSLVPFSTRLKLIRERERGWKYLDWKRRHTLKLPPTGSVYEFVGGLYANGRENLSRITASISFLELPSTGHDPDTPLQTWTHAMEDINIIDFTMDPSQDLLVLVALAPAESPFVYELHLRSIKTNGPHPNAPVSVLSCWKKPSPSQPSSDVFAAVRIQISGCLVALLIKEVQEVGAHLEIWNWECSSPSSSSMTRNSGIDDFTFLTQDSFLLVRPAGLFEVYTFNDPAKDLSPPQLRITYAFPALSHGYMYWYISMSSNPAPGYVPRPPRNPDNTTLSSDNQIYYPRPEERIHACCLYIFEPHNEDNMHVHSFVFFLNLRTLLNPAEEWLDKARALAMERKRRREQQQAVAAKFPPVANETSGATAQQHQQHPSSHTSPSGLPSQSSFTYHPPQTIPISTYPLFPSYSASGGPASQSNAATTPPVDSTTASPTVILNHNRRRSHGGHGHGAPSTSSMNINIAPCQCHPNAPPKDTRRPIERVPPNTVIPWEIWGPASTRWFEECINTDWQHAIYGLRTVESVQRIPAFGAPVPEGSIPKEMPAGVGEMDDEVQAWLLSHHQQRHHQQQQRSEAAAESESRGEGSSCGTAATAPSASGNTENALDGQPNDTSAGGNGNGASSSSSSNTDDNRSMRYLRVRDFNPYIFASNAGTAISTPSQGKKFWVEPRLVTESSLTSSKGVFQRDILSSLPYMEVISREMFKVTDVMMDDCRMLLLKRGLSGKLERVDVLMM